MGSVVKRGILQAFNTASYTADVLLLEATSEFLHGVPISTAVFSSNAIAGAYCAVLFFDEHNPNDCVVIAVYPNGSQGVPPSTIPGSITLVTPYVAVSNVVNSGTTSTFTLTNPGLGVPTSAKAVLVMVQVNCATANVRMQLAPHGGSIGNYMIVGNLYAANATIWGSGILPVNVNGQIDANAVGGNINLTIFVLGYVA